MKLLRKLGFAVSIISAAFFLTTSSGCLPLGTGFDGVEEFVKWRNEQRSLFSSYIGKSPDEIESIFGKPTAVYGSKPPTPKFPQGIDFLWVYSAPLPGIKSNAKVFDFSFKDNKLVLVDV